MSLFGSLMGMADVEDDPFFGSHMRNIHRMNSMMNSLFTHPFGMLNDGPLSIMGPRHDSSLMPFMPAMPQLNRLFSVSDLGDGNVNAGSSFSSSTVVMSSGPNGKPQIISSSSSTKIGPNGVKEVRKTHQDTRTGVKKMAIGHHIGERAHVIEREQNYYSGDAEERQEFINIEEDEAEQFDREFQERAGNYRRPAIMPLQQADTRLALPAPPAPSVNADDIIRRHRRPSARRPIRAAASPLATSSRYWRRRYY
ncbi:myeloid leukemia factor isoform X2 [Leptidea sinapis]|nr:myeloid leukemia factor isoform X2 [Leptidea sinapis]